MNGQVSTVSQGEMTRLISSKINKEEMEIFHRFVMASSTLWAGVYNGRLICVLGLVPPTLLSDRAYLWFHATEAAKDQFLIVRHSQIVVRKMLEMYPTIVGQCEVSAERSIRWLKWLGASFGEPEGQLVPFVIRRKEA